ncbi:protein-glutamate methylesterase/protein-glutamine glutaminase [Steroidobacter sp.]|uniref:protein-glutamate methylesterase/protein-glutamine glutaminase n=1 Tax=Steroidobacter sp. TaxID=1978227 RepID=UPI001A50A3D0|nr:chemotaxis response regulator protein-glutamate methylesterase [Steroidobacter sp.]MBL8270373.1 chemotaxis response regulator protein-glutamate methylesterase [Steroidobacter sp.]
MKQIGVMIVDDSAVVRQVVADVLMRDPQIKVIAAVSDPVFALERLKTLSPDVIVLDVEMPRMDGITFLRRLMNERPTPVVMCSSLTEVGAATTLDALAAGAVAIVTKPKMGVKNFLLDAAADLVAQVKVAAAANVKRLMPTAKTDARPATLAPASAPAPGSAMKRTTERIVAIGTSTGGTQALEEVLKVLPKDAPGIIVVQHMPERFTAAFAQRLDKVCEVTVLEATTGARLLPGHVLIAPGGKHLMLKRSGAYYYADVLDGALVNRHKPSVDVLFRSVASCAGANALGIIMTGMGDDGARGMKEMRDSGSATLAQDEASCVVFGMPKEAIRMGGAQRVLPLNEIAGAILAYAAGL